MQRFRLYENRGSSDDSSSNKSRLSNTTSEMFAHPPPPINPGERPDLLPQQQPLNTIATTIVPFQWPVKIVPPTDHFVHWTPGFRPRASDVLQYSAIGEAPVSYPLQQATTMVDFTHQLPANGLLALDHPKMVPPTNSYGVMSQVMQQPGNGGGLTNRCPYQFNNEIGLLGYALNQPAKEGRSVNHPMQQMSNGEGPMNLLLEQPNSWEALMTHQLQEATNREGLVNRPLQLTTDEERSSSLPLLQGTNGEELEHRPLEPVANEGEVVSRPLERPNSGDRLMNQQIQQAINDERPLQQLTNRDDLVNYQQLHMTNNGGFSYRTLQLENRKGLMSHPLQQVNHGEASVSQKAKMPFNKGNSLGSFELFAAQRALKRMNTLDVDLTDVPSPRLPTLNYGCRSNDGVAPRAITARYRLVEATPMVPSPHDLTANPETDTSSANNSGCLPAPKAPNHRGALFSRKVFIGGLPSDICDDDITTQFRRFGEVKVDWPHKVYTKSIYPPKGFAFLHFASERSVNILLNHVCELDSRLFYYIYDQEGKPWRIEVIPWVLANSNYIQAEQEELDPRKTVFVGGVPRPCSAYLLASAMERFFGEVVYAGIDTDREFRYPKGSGRVCFSDDSSYVKAITARFVEINDANTKKRVEIKPYVLDAQVCDVCNGDETTEKYAIFFCPKIPCLKYHCSSCWAKVHSKAELKFHKPLVKELRHGLQKTE